MSSSADAATRRSEQTESERAWLTEREFLVEHRYGLSVAAAADYPSGLRVEGTPLLAPESWVPAGPIPLESVQLEFTPEAPLTGIEGTEEDRAHERLPRRHDGSPYASYATAVAELAPPSVFEDRPTYRLLEADLTGGAPTLRFGRGSYFDSLNTGEAAAHEYAARRLTASAPSGIREAIGDPCDLTRRPVNVAISTLTIRRDESGDASFFVHWRDPAKVGHAGGLYQVVPVGVFQPSSGEPWNERHDFSLWKNVVRELYEELLGGSEDYASDQAPIDYDAWAFAARLSAGLTDGSVRAYCLGLGVDPLTFATDLLTVVSLDSTMFDDVFGRLVDGNSEGRVLAAKPFTEEVVDEFVTTQPMQAAGAALLRLALRDDIL